MAKVVVTMPSMGEELTFVRDGFDVWGGGFDDAGVEAFFCLFVFIFVFVFYAGVEAFRHATKRFDPKRRAPGFSFPPAVPIPRPPSQTSHRDTPSVCAVRVSCGCMPCHRVSSAY